MVGGDLVGLLRRQVEAEGAVVVTLPGHRRRRCGEAEGQGYTGGSELHRRCGEADGPNYTPEDLSYTGTVG